MPVANFAHFSAGKLMSKRSTAEVVWVFLVIPPLLIGVMASVMIYLHIARDTPPTTREWWSFAGGCLLFLLVALALPAAGIQELRKRSRGESAYEPDLPVQKI